MGLVQGDLQFLHYLMQPSYDWLKAVDASEEVCAISFNLCKAFDSVPHFSLFGKLKYIGLNEHLIATTKSYYMQMTYSSTELLQAQQTTSSYKILFTLLLNEQLNTQCCKMVISRLRKNSVPAPVLTLHNQHLEKVFPRCNNLLTIPHGLHTLMKLALT